MIEAIEELRQRVKAVKRAALMAIGEAFYDVGEWLSSKGSQVTAYAARMYR